MFSVFSFLNMKQVFISKLYIILFLIVLSAQLYMIAVNYKSWKLFSGSTEWLNHTYEVLLESEGVISSLKDIETGSRGYIITGDEFFLNPYNRALPVVTTHISKLRSLTADNHHQHKRVDTLNYLTEKRLDNALQSIILRRSRVFTDNDNMLIKQGKVYMDSIRYVVNQIKAEELVLLSNRKEQNNLIISESKNQFLIVSVFSIVLFTGGFIYIGRNIRESKNSEEELRLLLDSAPDAIVVVNSQGRIELVNKQTERIFGFNRSELIGNNVEVLIPSEFHGKHVRHRTNYFGEPNVRPMGAGLELYGQRKDESRFPVEISLSPIITRKGRMVSAAIRDITDKKIVQQQLQQLNADLELKVMERTAEIADYKYALDESCIVAITDQKGIIKYANNNFCAISKYTEQELIGQDHRIINSGYHSREFIRNIWTTIATGNIWRGELKNKAKDGSFYWVDTTIVPFLNNQGKPYQYVAIRSDITRRKQVEEELQNLNTDLEHQVKTRTEQLVQVNEELEAFTYSVSHDLRAPLRIIDGYGDILLTDYNDKLDEEARRLLNIIMSNARYMGQLIDDLLNLSRLGRKDLLKHRTDMNVLVSEVLSEQRLLSSIHVKIITGDLLPAFCDPQLMKQVWVNLISNAVKYSSKREESVIEIGSFVSNSENIYMIKDNGVGFNMEYSEKLFGVFQRLHKMSEFSGTGVGLAIVKRIINKHEGKVWANAEQDKGATFYFSIPTQEIT